MWDRKICLCLFTFQPLAVWPIPTESPRTTLKGGEIPINPRARVAVLLSLPVDSGHTQTCDAHHGHLPHFEIGTLELDLPP
ncbi:hypothetical protein R3P38DRAFT_2957443 [Favolaschia claudopus]|uniref:Secreted protein n=1 Tax=Favolaschia claudopus TaxID=2862362 RepID=A0AAW0BBA7_9AGAR